MKIRRCLTEIFQAGQHFGCDETTKKFNNQQSKGNYLYGNAHG
jgi:hypothetical protein